MYKINPIANYLLENKAKSYHVGKNIVELKNPENKLIGRIYKGKGEFDQYSYVNIDLFDKDSGEMFMAAKTIIERTYRYFLKEHKFMPVKIEIEKQLFDFKRNTLKKENITKGLKSNLYIEQLKESDELKQERNKLGEGIPDDFPMYKINKPFKYEFKAHLYYPKRAIDQTKSIVKE